MKVQFLNNQLLSLAINKLIQFQIIAAENSTGRLAEKIALIIYYIQSFITIISGKISYIY